MNLDELIPALKPSLVSFVERSRNDFMSRFGHWVSDGHLPTLESVFLQCGYARVELLYASDAEDISMWEEVVQTNLRRLETIGLEILIIGSVDTRQFLRDEIALLASYIPIIAASFIKVLLPLLAPGVGGLAATPISAVVQYILEKVEGVK